MSNLKMDFNGFQEVDDQLYALLLVEEEQLATAAFSAAEAGIEYVIFDDESVAGYQRCIGIATETHSCLSAKLVEQRFVGNWIFRNVA